MIVQVNNFVLNDGTTGVWLDVEIDGLEMPPLRTSSGNYAGRDGGYVGSQFYSPRAITLQGNVFASDIATLETARKNFMAALKGNSVTLKVTTNAGNAYIVFCNLINFQMPIKRSLFEAPFKLDLIAADPTVYDNATGTALTATVPKLVAGGYTYKVIYPVIYAAGTTPTTITNSGTTVVYPIITLTGVMNNPIITNTTTNVFFSIPSFTTVPSDTVVIDMRQRTILLNGGSIFNKVSSTSTWWNLQPGGNAISLTTSTGGDTVSGLVSWRSGYLGI